MLVNYKFKASQTCKPCDGETPQTVYRKDKSIDFQISKLNYIVELLNQKSALIDVIEVLNFKIKSAQSELSILVRFVLLLPTFAAKPLTLFLRWLKSKKKIIYTDEP